MFGSRKGLTLLEIIAASIIMSAGIIFIMRFAPVILRAKSGMEIGTEKAFLALQKTEELKGKVLYDFNKAGGYGVTEEPFAPPHDKYRCSVTDSLDPSNNIRTIEVDVWHIDNPDSKFILHTKIARR